MPPSIKGIFLDDLERSDTPHFGFLNLKLCVPGFRYLTYSFTGMQEPCQEKLLN